MADIVFLVDGSASIGLENFQQIREFVSLLIGNLEVATDRIRIGLVQYSDTPHTEFSLNTYQNKEDILRYIQNLRYKTGGTFTGQGLEFMLKQHFVETAGSRAQQSVPQIAIIITGGESQDEVGSQAQELRQRGIKIFTIGIKDAKETLLRQIASEPYDQHVYSISDFAALSNKILPFALGCNETAQADIVLLVDSSGSIGASDFEEVRKFLHAFVDTVVLYSDFPRADVYFNTFSDKTDILRYISSMPYGRGKTYTGAALKFAEEHVFTKARGSRRDHNVQQVAVVVTDGKSTDNVARAAAALRRSGVTVFALGIKDTEEDDLREIASYPHKKFVFSVEGFDKLNSLSNILTKTLCSECPQNQGRGHQD
uniref:VWFA domain-containing protein n=1 Tax=Cyprinus carpio TaxID=7962 RepID=A0A8C2EF11_CYPCA